MNRKRVLKTAFVSLLLFSALVGVQFVNLASANFVPPPLPRIYIRSDGIIDPSTAPIKRVGDVYTFTGNITNYVIEVQCSDIVIDGAGYTLQGLEHEKGIILAARSNVTIKNTQIRKFNMGIYVDSASNNNIIGNKIIDNGQGIWICDQSRNDVISENYIANSYCGISIYNSGNNVLRKNSVVDNAQNFVVKGESLYDFVNDVDASNTVNGKPIYYWINQQDRAVSSDAGCVILVNCTGITVQNLNLSKNGQGLLLGWTTNSRIVKNHITNNGFGLYLFVSPNNFIIENSIIGNHGYGINLEESHNIDISKNNITDNWGVGISLSKSQEANIIGNTITANWDNGINLWYQSSKNVISENYIAENRWIGIEVADSFDNKIIGNNVTENYSWSIQLRGAQKNNIIYRNNFINNKAEGLQVPMPGPAYANIWDNGKEGNYWSDYRTRYPNATEIDGSGIGDTPFFINENNIDHYPLMEPVVIPEFPDGENPTPLLIAVPFVLAIIVGVAIYRRRNSGIQQTPIPNNSDEIACMHKIVC